MVRWIDCVTIATGDFVFGEEQISAIISEVMENRIITVNGKELE